MKTLLFITRSMAIMLIVFSLSVSCTEKKKNKENTTETEATTKAESTTTEEAKEESTPESNGEVALNPAHGQPGHRCDIKVGAPLDSAPKKSNATNSGSPLINPGSGKLNPPHGQPGHRCDIKVGDPL
jgi:hypothetical protein